MEARMPDAFGDDEADFPVCEACLAALVRDSEAGCLYCLLGTLDREGEDE